MAQQRLFSGIQPSGALGIGGYVGAVQHWIAMQAQYQCLFCVVDLHAITVRQAPQTLHENCLELLAMYLACGIDPQRSTVFLQSHVPEHSQLAWLLNCFAYMGELNRMTQFKDKSQQHAANINVGLFDYPVLMAADILLYGTHVVPVGEDQKQHLELARDLAVRFNQQYGDVFVIPEPVIAETGARIMDLQDPTRKMSKSIVGELNYLALLDAPEVVERKIKRAVTDSQRDIDYQPVQRPGVSNLLEIYHAVSGRSIEQLIQDYQGKGYGDFKTDLAEAMVEFLAPIQAHYAELRADQAYLQQVLAEGAAQAREIAAPLLARVSQAIGFVLPS